MVEALQSVFCKKNNRVRILFYFYALILMFSMLVKYIYALWNCLVLLLLLLLLLLHFGSLTSTLWKCWCPRPLLKCACASINAAKRPPRSTWQSTILKRALTDGHVARWPRQLPACHRTAISTTLDSELDGLLNRATTKNEIRKEKINNLL